MFGSDFSSLPLLCYCMMGLCLLNIDAPSLVVSNSVSHMSLNEMPITLVIFRFIEKKKVFHCSPLLLIYGSVGRAQLKGWSVDVRY